MATLNEQMTEIEQIVVRLWEIAPELTPVHCIHGTPVSYGALVTMPLAELLNLYALELARREERMRDCGESK